MYWKMMQMNIQDERILIKVLSEYISRESIKNFIKLSFKSIEQ